MTIQELNEVKEAVQMAGLSNKKFLTFDEATSFIGVSKSCLYKLTSSGGISHYKPRGKMIYFDRLEIESWLLQNRVSTTAEIEAQDQSYCMNNRKGSNK